MLEMNRFAAVVALWFAVGIVGAEKAQAATVTSKGTDAYGQSSFTYQHLSGTPLGWSDGTKMTSAGNDYVIDGHQLRTPCESEGNKNFTFVGKSLTLKNNGGFQLKTFHTFTATFNNLIVAEGNGGKIVNQSNIGDGPKKAGDILTVTGSPWTLNSGSTLSFENNGTDAGHSNRYVSVDATLVGSGAFACINATTSTQPVTSRLNGNLSNFHGKLSASGSSSWSFRFGPNLTSIGALDGGFAADGVSLAATPKVFFDGTLDFGATRGVTIDNNLTLTVASGKTVTMSAPVTAPNGFVLGEVSTGGAGTLVLSAANPGLDGTINLQNGATLKLANTNAVSRATIAGPTTSGKSATLVFDTTAIGAAGATLEALPQNNVSYKVTAVTMPASMKFRVFMVPGEVAAPAKSAFTLMINGVAFDIDSVQAVPLENGGTAIEILLPDADGVNALTLKGTDGYGASSMSGAGSPGGWSDNTKAAVSGKDYRVNDGGGVKHWQLRTPDYNTSYKDYAFAGRRLFYTSGCLSIKVLQSRTFTLPQLIVDENGSCIVEPIWDHVTVKYDYASDLHLAGSMWFVKTGGTLTLGLSAGNPDQDGRAWSLEAPVSGPGALVCAGNAAAGYTLRTRLHSNLSGLSGPISLQAPGAGTATFEIDSQVVGFGVMDAVRTDGFTIDGPAVVNFNGSFELDETRGMTIVGRPKISIAEGETVTVNGAFSAADGFVKQGAGRLVLSGSETAIDRSKVEVLLGEVQLPDGTVLTAESVADLLGSDLYDQTHPYQSSMAGVGNPAGWSNGEKSCSPGISYRVVNGYQLRTPDYSSTFADYEFPGDKLIFTNGTLSVKILQGQSLTIPHLSVETNGIGNLQSVWDRDQIVGHEYSAESDMHLRGMAWEIFKGGQLQLSLSASNDAQNERAYALEAPLTGEGELVGNCNAAAEQYTLRIRFNGDLSGFTGPITLNSTGLGSATFEFGAAVGSIGAMGAASATGLTVTGNSIVKFNNSLSLDATRGVTMTGRPWIWVAAGKTVTVNGTFAAPDGFVLCGPGRFVLRDATGLDTSKIEVLSGAVELPGGTELKEPGLAPVKANFIDAYVALKLGGRDAVLAEAEAVPAIGNDGKWGDIDYTYTGRSNWEPLVHVQRCQKLAAAVALGAADSTAYVATIVSAMNAWYQQVPTSENWYQALIGVPQAVGYTAILAENEIKAANPTVFSNMVENTEVSITEDVAQTGQNLTWVRGIRVMNGLLTDDALAVRVHSDVIKGEVRVVGFGTEGLQSDWCFHQHGIQPQISNYGLSFLRDNVFWINTFKDSVFTYPQEKFDLVANMASNCFAWSAWKGTMSPDTMGRQIFLSMHSQGASMTNAIMRLLGEVAEPVGYRYFSQSAYAVNRTADWMATVKMGTKDIITTESGNYENLKGKFLGDGAIYTYVTGEEYNDVYALWDDWRMVPGVTQLRGVGAGYPEGWSIPPELGGNFRTPKATISNNSAKRTVTFTYGPEEGLSYRKTWTFVDNGYDVSVAGITSTAASEVATCVESANAAADAGIVTQNERYSVYHNGEIYYIVWAAPEDITFTLEDRAGNVGDYATYYPREVIGRLFRIVVSHGQNPSNAEFKYSVRIGGWDKEEFDPSPRTITVTRISRVEGVRQLTLTFSTPNLHWTNALLVAYGDLDAAGDLAAWEHLELLDAEVLPQDETFVWMASSEFEAAKFARFFFVNPECDPEHWEAADVVGESCFYRQPKGLILRFNGTKGKASSGTSSSSISEPGATPVERGWPYGCAPQEISRRVTEQLLAADPLAYKPEGTDIAKHISAGYGGGDSIFYATVSLWVNALDNARQFGEADLEQQLIDKFAPYLSRTEDVLKPQYHVDYNVVGALPLAVARLTGDSAAATLGTGLADYQWSEPPATMPTGLPGTPTREQALARYEDGYTGETRLWIDDMYMINLLQTEAYKLTQDAKYLDRAAKEMVLYLDELQLANGLFYHTTEVPFVWGRGAGWMAAGMPLVLKYLPENHQHRAAILAGYRKMMAKLLDCQKSDGLWGQLADDPTTWSETSGSAMFAYGMAEGVAQGWLDRATYAPVARKAYLALCQKLDKYGNLADVCVGTNAKNDRAYYLARARVNGDPHGQAPMLWLCGALGRW